MIRRRVASLPLLGLASCAMLGLTACSEEPRVLDIGSGGTLGNYYSTARAIARVVNEGQPADGFRVRELASTGSVANINGILSGALAFGIAQADREQQAVQGVAGWQAAGPRDQLRALFSLHSDAITVVATAASGIRTAADLVGKRVDIGHPESGVRKNAIDALEAAGIDWEKDLQASELETDERVSTYLRGDLDAFFHTVGHPTVDIKFAVNSVPRARLVPLVNIDLLVALHPYYARTSIPVSLYPGILNREDVETVGVKAILLTSADVPDDVVYAVTKAVLEDIASLGKFDPILQGLAARDMLEGMTAPLHPGASRYYEEAGLLDAGDARP